MARKRTYYPACPHRDKPTKSNFRVEWVRGVGWHPHRHCDECNVTAKMAMPSKTAMHVRGYAVTPEGVRECDLCGEWYEPGIDSDSPHLCGGCDAEHPEYAESL